MNMSKIYVDSADGMLDQEAMVATAKVLGTLVENQDHITFSGDAEGHYFEVPEDVLKKFLEATSSPKPKRGRPRKVVEAVTELSDAGFEVAEGTEDEAPSNESEPEE